jgi:hypothetical protein
MDINPDSPPWLAVKYPLSVFVGQFFVMNLKRLLDQFKIDNRIDRIWIHFDEECFGSGSGKNDADPEHCCEYNRKKPLGRKS